MAMSVLRSASFKAAAKNCSSGKTTGVIRPLLASPIVKARPAVRTYAQVSKEDNQGLVQFQPFDEVGHARKFCFRLNASRLA